MHRHVWKVVEKTRELTVLERLIASGGSTVVDGYRPSSDRPSTVVMVRCARCSSEMVYRI